MIEIAFLAESLDPERGGAERALRAVSRALVRTGAVVALVGPTDRLGPVEPGVRLVGVDLGTRARARRAKLLAHELAPRARRELPAARIVAAGKVLFADALWSHGGVHAAARDAKARAGRGPLLGLVARLARGLRPVESVFDAIEEENARAIREGKLIGLALSERVRRDLEAIHRVDPARVTVVRNGVEAKPEVPALERERARLELEELSGASRDDVVALFAAHQFALKGLDRAIAGLARAPRARLVVAGRDDRAPFEQQARALAVTERITFVGALPARELARTLPAVDVLVHPSRYDPCSLVVLEALAAGVPVIASRADGSSELVREGAGWVLERPDDPGELGERLAALDDPSLRASLREGARRCLRTTDDVARELIAALG